MLVLTELKEYFVKIMPPGHFYILNSLSILWDDHALKCYAVQEKEILYFFIDSSGFPN